MLISVIVPVYNVEKYVKQCLDSLIQQTYKELEVILVDDGSQDASGHICEEYASLYDYFKVIHKENAGLGMARNTGLECATGQYVTFVDSDDYLDKNAIEVLYKGLVENGVDMCKGGFRRVKNDGTILMDRSYRREVYNGIEAKDILLPRMIGSSPSQHDSVEMCVCGAIYNMAPIKEYNLRFPSEREFISEDLVFNIDYMQHANGACLIAEVGYNYRVNLGSLSTSYRADRFEASKHFYEEVKKKLLKLDYGNETILRLNRMFFIFLKMCINQEKLLVSKKQFRNSVNNIGKICEDIVVNNAIDTYPIRYLGMRQKVFLLLIKKRMKMILYILAKLGKL